MGPRTALLLCAVLLVVPTATVAAGHPVAPAALTRPEPLADFADHLLETGEYFRALGEYERLAFFAPTPSWRRYARRRAAYTLLRARRPARAWSLLPDRPRPGLAPVDRLLAAWAALELTGPAAARPWLLPATTPEATALAALTAAYARAWWEAQRRLTYLGELDLAALVATRAEERDPSPWLAALLSGLVPGSGQWYAGRPGDGLYTFLVLAGLGGATWYLARSGATTGALVFGGLTAIFYGGNVYGAWRAAERVTADRDAAVLEALRPRLLPPPPARP